MKISEIIHTPLHESSHGAEYKVENSGVKIYYLSVDGKILSKEDGTPLQFRGKAHATAYLNKVKAKDPSKVIRISTSAQDPQLISEDAYDTAEQLLRDAKAAKEQGDLAEYNTLMADYHDMLVQWHESKGRYAAADKHAAEVEKYNAAATRQLSKSDFE